MNSLIKILTTVSLASSIVRCLPTENQSPTPANSDEFVKIHDSNRQIVEANVNASDIAPQSKIYNVHFDLPVLQSPSGTISGGCNNTQPDKQSQEFDLGAQVMPGMPSSATVKPAPVSPVSNTTTTPQLVSSIVAATTSTSTTSTAQPLTTTTSSNHNDESSTTSSDHKNPTVATSIVREGNDVMCGEANPMGKSNKNLVRDRIIGGSKSEPGEFPFQVRLDIRSKRGSGICGGVILDEHHILTAAHCMTLCMSYLLNTATIDTQGVHATIGDHSIKSEDGELEVEIDKIIPHEKYDACNFYANDHDIALIRTTKPIGYKFTSDGYGSINRPCLPGIKSTLYGEGELMIVSGWGVTRDNSGALSNILRYVQVPYVNVTQCQDTYGTRVTNDHICAGFPAGGKDSCQGDSGGPLVRVVDNRYELVGIVSFGYGCGLAGAPGVYTRVASYLDWIKVNTQAS